MRNLILAIIATWGCAAAGATTVTTFSDECADYRNGALADVCSAAAADTVLIINDPTAPAPDDIYDDAEVEIAGAAVEAETPALSVGEWQVSRHVGRDLATLGDGSHHTHWLEWAVPGAVLTASALAVKMPALVTVRQRVQDHLSNHGRNKTKVDDYMQYAPYVEAYALQFCGYKGQHTLLDRTLLLGMSYLTFAVTSRTMKYAFREKRPDSDARNSFPSGHTGTAVVGAEFLRREYWHRNKWVAMSGYLFAASVAYLRIYNDRHWINDVLGGAALGYLSTTFAYWLYPRIFRHRTRMHRERLLEQLPQTERHTPQTVWLAAPYASAGNYGLTCSITF